MTTELPPTVAWTPESISVVPQTILSTLAQIGALEGWCTVEKSTVLASIVLTLKPRCIVELGVFGGRSLIALALAARSLGPPELHRVTGIDPWTKEAALEGSQTDADAAWWSSKVDYERIYSGFVKAVQDFGVLPWCYWHRMRSMDARCLFPPAGIDLLHQDSNHSEEISCAEVDGWRKKMAPESTWILDDADWSSQTKAIGLIEAAGFQTIHDAGKYRIFHRSPAPVV